MSVSNEQVQRLKEELKGIAEDIKGTDAWTLKNTVKLGIEIVKHVEKIGVELKLAGSDKLDLSCKVLDDLIQLPIWLEPFDEWAFKLMLTAIVEALNKFLGKVWIEKI